MQFLEIIQNPSSTIGQKYTSFFELKNLNRLDLLLLCFPFLNSSEYLRHEVIYIMGQMPATADSIAFLSQIVADEEE
jgi:hypothetical protein